MTVVRERREQLIGGIGLEEGLDTVVGIRRAHDSRGNRLCVSLDRETEIDDRRPRFALVSDDVEYARSDAGNPAGVRVNLVDIHVPFHSRISPAAMIASNLKSAKPSGGGGLPAHGHSTWRRRLGELPS